ncbi:MAG: carbon starvation protein A [Spirochaetaceae bacterium]|nr:MAG: carbon starvation protein A [Spirochaetaceae bacterium]
MTTIIVIVGAVVYAALYWIYGKKMETEVVKADDSIQTPAHRMYDGVDYVPTRTSVLFGHHFASVAGAAPIVGPVVAMAWGWVPALAWVWFGNIFIGAVHDYLSVMASVRYDGKSIQFVASDLVTKRSGYLFYILVFFLLILVVAAFAAVLGGMFLANPGIPAAATYLLVAAVLMGHLMYKTKIPFAVTTVIGIVLLLVVIWLATVFPLVASRNTWFLAMFFYIIVAAALPVQVLLQPRDYLNAWLLYFGLVLGGLGAIFAFSGFTAPAFTSFSPIISAGRPTPFWPVIPLIIACGSLSGFHSLVASGTTSKQLSSEKAGLPIGYGVMLVEGFLSTIVVIAVAGWGMQVMTGAGQTISVAGWSTQYTPAMMGSFPNAAMFSETWAAMIADTWLNFIPEVFLRIIAGMWVSSFALTTLDSTNRLARYTLAEIFLPLKKTSESAYRFLSNRWIASIIPAAIGIWLGWSGSFGLLWPSFGSANQLIASIALLTGTAWVTKRLKTKATYAFIPAMGLWVTVTAAMIWYLAVVIPVTVASAPATGVTVAIITVIMLIINFVFIFDFFKTRNDPLADTELGAE